MGAAFHTTRCMPWAKKNGDGIYAATPLEDTAAEGLTVLNLTIRLPQAETLTGISITAPAGKVLWGGFTYDESVVTATSASASHRLFVEFRKAEGEYQVDLAAGEGIRFALPIAPVALENGELAVRLHVLGNAIYETTVKHSITPGDVVEVTLDDFSAA